MASNTERDFRICSRYRQGEHAPALAREFGVSHQRVYQIIRKDGMETETEKEAAPGFTRSIYGLNEDWALVDALADKLKWSRSEVVQAMMRKVASENVGDVHGLAVNLVTFNMGWSPNAPAADNGVERS
jgi:hypothetical protein